MGLTHCGGMKDEDFVEREADGFGLAPEKFAANAVHGDAVVAFRNGGEKSDDAQIRLLEQRV